MLIEPPTAVQLTDTFQRVLGAIDEGSMSGAPVCVGLDEATTAALDALAADRRHRAANIMAARRAFAARLDATSVPADETAYLAALVVN